MVSKYAGKKNSVLHHIKCIEVGTMKVKKICDTGKIAKEIAEELGIEESNVRKLRQRIRDVTKDSLEM